MDPRFEQPMSGTGRGALPPLDDRTPGVARTLALLRRWRTTLLAAALTAGIVGYAATSLGTPTYQTSATLLVGPVNTDLDTLRAAGQIAQSYAQIAETRPVISETERSLGLNNIDNTISASANDVTRLLTITVRDHDAKRGAQIANAHARTLVRRFTAGRTSTSVPGPGSVQLVDPAEAADAPSGPGAVPIAIVCALAGLLGALGLAALLDRSSETLRGADDVPALTGAGSLGLLGRAAWRAGRRATAVDRAPGSRAADEYRLMATKLRVIGERSIAVLRVDDAAGGVAANLAAAMSERGARVVMLDVDAGRALLLASGAPPELLAEVDSADVVEAADARHVLEQLLGDADLVLVDLPSLASSSTGLVWAAAVEGTLLTAQIDRTRRRDVLAAANSLRLVHARLLGTIVGAPPGVLPSRGETDAPRARPAKKADAARATAGSAKAKAAERARAVDAEGSDDDADADASPRAEPRPQPTPTATVPAARAAAPTPQPSGDGRLDGDARPSGGAQAPAAQSPVAAVVRPSGDAPPPRDGRSDSERTPDGPRGDRQRPSAGVREDRAKPPAPATSVEPPPMPGRPEGEQARGDKASAAPGPGQRHKPHKIGRGGDKHRSGDAPSGGEDEPKHDRPDPGRDDKRPTDKTTA